jgi:hypothetical protein
MHRFNRQLILRLVLVLLVPVVTLSAQSPPAQAPRDPLIGTWQLNVAKSTYPGTPPKSQIRTFDYTIDGMILVAYETVNAQGAKSFAHWYLSLDGKEHPEFSRATGATPTFYLAGKAIDANTKEVRDRRVEGEGRPPLIIMYTIAVSPDGQTLTMTAKSTNAEGKPTVTVAVYDKQF